MSANLNEFTDTNFEAEVLKSETPVLVDFGADWCPPCQMLAPTIEAIASQYSGKVHVGTLNVDKNPKVAIKYKVSSLPTVALFHKGELVEQHVGLRPPKFYTALLDKHLQERAA